MSKFIENLHVRNGGKGCIGVYVRSHDVNKTQHNNNKRGS